MGEKRIGVVFLSLPAQSCCFYYRKPCFLFGFEDTYDNDIYRMNISDVTGGRQQLDDRRLAIDNEMSNSAVGPYTATRISLILIDIMRDNEMPSV